MKLIPVLFAAVFICESSSAQVQKMLSAVYDDYAVRFEQKNNGNFLLTGTSGSFGTDASAFLMEVGGSFSSQWLKVYDGPGADYSNAFVKTDDGYLLAGCSSSFGQGNTDGMILKTGLAGNLLWVRSWGGSKREQFTNAVQTSDGDFVLFGETESFGAGSWDLCLIRTDEDGNLRWTKIFGGGSGEFACGLAQVSDGGFVITGHTLSFGAGDWDIFIIKTDADGSILWQKTFGDLEYEKGYSVRELSDGNILVSGATLVILSTYQYDYRGCVLKLAQDGTLIWQKNYNLQDGEIFQNVREEDNGRLIFSGSTLLMSQYNNPLLLVTDADGIPVFGRQFGDAQNGWARDGMALGNGEYALLSFKEKTFLGDRDIYVVSTGENQLSGCWDKNVTVQVENGILKENTPSFLVGASGAGLDLQNIGEYLAFSFQESDPCLMTGVTAGLNIKKEMIIYPNPTSGRFINLHFGLSPGDNEPIIVRIYNATGQEVSKKKLNMLQRGQYEEKVDISSFSAGVYFIKLQHGGEETKEKFLVYPNQ